MRTLSFFLFIFSFGIVCAQLDKSAAFVGLTGRMAYNYQTGGTHSQFGMELLVPVGEKVNLHYSFSMGTNEYRKYAAYTSLGMYVGGWVVDKSLASSASTGDWLGLFLLISAAIPEGISVHVPLNQSKTIFLTPYIKPFGTDYNLYNDFRWNYCVSAGTRIGIFASKEIVIAPELGVKYTLAHPSGTGGQTNIYAGIGLWLHTKNEN